MTPAELHEIVARAICISVTGNGDLWREFAAEAEAAIRVVREAMREPSVYQQAAGLAELNWLTCSVGCPQGTCDDAANVWRAMLAASPLREE